MKCVYNGVIDSTSPDLCQGVVFLEPHDLVAVQEQPFDTELFTIIITALFVSFITGHFTGRVSRWLGKL
ncbi:hypothetical protein A3712_08360 [Vibrio sp. HI00D65]|nr:hypothetical protein A3712_08360 [Vibrio sp. HI00D65]PMM29936.1 hypothetical protein BCT58_27315 [Vibrio lentus]